MTDTRPRLALICGMLANTTLANGRRREFAAARGFFISRVERNHLNTKKAVPCSQEEREMSDIQQTLRPNPSD
jgi:hypothetical protein